MVADVGHGQLAVVTWMITLHLDYLDYPISVSTLGFVFSDPLSGGVVSLRRGGAGRLVGYRERFNIHLLLFMDLMLMLELLMLELLLMLMLLLLMMLLLLHHDMVLLLLHLLLLLRNGLGQDRPRRRCGRRGQTDDVGVSQELGRKAVGNWDRTRRALMAMTRSGCGGNCRRRRSPA